MNYKAIDKALAKGHSRISLPIGRPDKKQMQALRKRYPTWDIQVPQVDPFGAYISFTRRKATS